MGMSIEYFWITSPERGLVNPLDELLPDTAPEGVTTPAQRYLELKEAILNHQ